MNFDELKVAFIHGRPQGHPIHALYAKQLHAKFFFEDLYFRWHDKPNALKIKRYLSWFVSALFFPERRKYQVYFTECIRIPVLVMKLLGLISRQQRLIALMADESLYFNAIGKYPKYSSFLMKLFLRKTDAIICIGEFQTVTAKRLLNPDEHFKIYTIFNGVPSNRQKELMAIGPDLDSQNILFIGNASVDWRIWYKGVDIMIHAFVKALESNSNLKFYLVGEMDEQRISDILKPYDLEIRASIFFVGHTQKIEDYIKQSSLYLHCSRGDAFPTTILETLAAGLIPIISDCTGTIEVIRKIDERLIVSLEAKTIAEKINWFFGLSRDDRVALSNRCRLLSSDYSEEKAVLNFRNTFQKIVKDLEISY